MTLYDGLENQSIRFGSSVIVLLSVIISHSYVQASLTVIFIGKKNVPHVLPYVGLFSVPGKFQTYFSPTCLD